jgi:hypothetical protein
MHADDNICKQVEPKIMATSVRDAQMAMDEAAPEQPSHPTQTLAPPPEEASRQTPATNHNDQNFDESQEPEIVDIGAGLKDLLIQVYGYPRFLAFWRFYTCVFLYYMKAQFDSPCPFLYTCDVIPVFCVVRMCATLLYVCIYIYIYIYIYTYIHTYRHMTQARKLALTKTVEAARKQGYVKGTEPWEIKDETLQDSMHSEDPFDMMAEQESRIGKSCVVMSRT